MPAETPLFQQRDGDLAVEVRRIDGRRSTELLRRYQKDGERRVTGRLGYADQHRGAKLLKAAKDWINEQDRAEGQRSEAERQEPEGHTMGLKYGQRIRERRQAAGMER